MSTAFSAHPTSHSHHRQTSVASFASSLYLPVDPNNPPQLDDEDDTYPSSDELFGPDHEEGDDYTISSRRCLSHSRYSSAFSHPPTPPRSTRSTMSSSSLSLTLPHTRHGNTESGTPSAWSNRPAIIRTMAHTTTAELPSPPSTARSSNDTHMSASQATDPGVPIEKFEQLALEHLEQDRALLKMLQRLDEQKARISQLTYALSRLRVLSNSACLLPPDPHAPRSGSGPGPSSIAAQPRRLGAVIPKPLIIQQSPKSATSSSFMSGAGLTGPSQNEAINQRRRAKQQLHEFALRRPTRAAPKTRLGAKPAAAAAENSRRRGWEWEGARGSSSMVARDTRPRSAAVDAIGHPNVTIRRPKRSDAPPDLLAKSPARPPRPSLSLETPPRLASIFSSPGRTPTQSRLSVHESPSAQHRLSGSFDPPTPVPPRKHRDKPLPLLPIGRPRNVSYTYEIPPLPSPEHTTAHVTLVDRTTPPLPVEEVQNRLAATFAHFSHRLSQSQSQSQQFGSPPRRALDVDPGDSFGPMDHRREPDYLQEMLHRKWVAQLDEHSHQARGSWKSPLKSIKQRLVSGFGAGGGSGSASKKANRTSVSMSSSEDHSSSIDAHGYVHGLGTLQESEDGFESKPKKSKKKATKDEAMPGTPRATKSAWRFSRLGSSSS